MDIEDFGKIFDNSDTSIDISQKILKESPSWDKYDVILGEHIYLNQIPLIKILKYGKLAFCEILEQS